MSQGLTWIAARRMPLVALVALFALTVGMFAAFSPTHAAVGDNVGDVDATKGFCVETTAPVKADPGNNVDAVAGVWTVRTMNDPNSGVAVMVYHPDDTNDVGEVDEAGVQGDAGTKPDAVALTCAAGQAGNPVKITPNGTITPLIEVQSPTVTVSLNDSDGIVNSGASGVTVTVKVANFETDDVNVLSGGDITLDWVRMAGVLAASNQNEGTGGPPTVIEAIEISGLVGGAASFAAIPLVIPAGQCRGRVRDFGAGALRRHRRRCSCR